MKTLVLLCALSLSAPAADHPAVDEADALRLENTQLKAQVLQLQLAALQAKVEGELKSLQSQHVRLLSGAYALARVTPAEYDLDLERRVFTKKAAAPAEGNQNGKSH